MSNSGILRSHSPNFDNRTLPISLLVMHYTGMKTGKEALERLCDEKSKVSSHYLVFENDFLNKPGEQDHNRHGQQNSDKRG